MCIFRSSKISNLRSELLWTSRCRNFISFPLVALLLQVVNCQNSTLPLSSHPVRRIATTVENDANCPVVLIDYQLNKIKPSDFDAEVQVRQRLVPLIGKSVANNRSGAQYDLIAAIASSTGDPATLHSCWKPSPHHEPSHLCLRFPRQVWPSSSFSLSACAPPAPTPSRGCRSAASLSRCAPRSPRPLRRARAKKRPVSTPAPGAHAEPPPRAPRARRRRRSTRSPASWRRRTRPSPRRCAPSPAGPTASSTCSSTRSPQGPANRKPPADEGRAPVSCA